VQFRAGWFHFFRIFFFFRAAATFPVPEKWSEKAKIMAFADHLLLEILKV